MEWDTGSLPRLVRHRADGFFYFCGVEHDDGVPGAAVQEAAFRVLAHTFLAADTEERVDFDAAGDDGRLVSLFLRGVISPLEGGSLFSS